MTFPSPLDVGRNIATGVSSFVKHGHNGVASTVYVPVTTGGYLQMPMPSGAKSLKVTAASANDTALGTGARQLILVGLDANGDQITEILNTSGLTPSSYTTQEFWRLNFADVFTSGTYATAIVGSHAGAMTITDNSGAIWAMIDLNGYPHSRWQSAWYHVPNGKKVYIAGYRVEAESNKLADVKIIARNNALISSAPFSPMVELTELSGTDGGNDVDLPYVFGPLLPGTDIGAICRFQSGTGQLSFDVDFVVEISG